METFVHVQMHLTPFAQWGEIGGSDVLYLLPWVLVIWLLVPKGGDSKTLRVSWRVVLISCIAVVGVAFLVLVMYYTVSGA